MIDFIWWLLSYVVPFLAVLTIIVFVHEMGHYLVARWNGIAIEAFSIGFGKELAGFTDRNGTRWKIAAIPLGGYVKFVGDMNAASMPDPEKANQVAPELREHLFVNKNVWRRIAVVVAGPAANVLFTFVVLYALLMGYGRYTVEPIIETIVEGSVAEQAGFLAGDRILTVDGFKVRGFEDFQRLVLTAPGRVITVEAERSGQELTLEVVPTVTEINDRFGNLQRVGRIGVSRETGPEDVTLYHPGPIEAVGMTFDEINFIIDRTVAFLADFFKGRGDLDQLGGPVKVAQVSGDVASLGIIALINLMALLSLNIGIFNLLPIPVLDGGHLVFYLAEAVRGKPLSIRVQEIGFRLGFALVLTLMALTLVNDLF